MTDIVEDGVAVAEKTLEAAAGTVITKIASGAVKLWNEAEALIDADVDKIKSALPASALPNFDAVVSDVKQGASDTLTLAGGALSAAAPTFTKGLEGLADTAMATVSNGEALPLVPLVNSGIDELVNLGVAALQAWGLQQKAALAKAA